MTVFRAIAILCAKIRPPDPNAASAVDNAPARNDLTFGPMVTNVVVLAMITYIGISICYFSAYVGT